MEYLWIILDSAKFLEMVKKWSWCLSFDSDNCEEVE